MAFLMSTDCQCKNGTVSDPPPIDTMAETAPISSPLPNRAVAGNSGRTPWLRCAPRSICSETNPMKQAKKMASARDPSWLATKVAAKVPVMMPGASARTTGTRTLPRR